MTDRSHKIDGEGNLVGDDPTGDAPANDATAPVTPEQARSTVRAIVLAEATGVLLLLAGAAYYSDLREVLLIAAALYALTAVAMTAILRRSIYRRVEKSPPS
jgi:hypothetical protein